MRRNDRPRRTPFASELSAEQASGNTAPRCARCRGGLVEERRRRHFARHRPCRYSMVADVRSSWTTRRRNSLPSRISKDYAEGLPLRRGLASSGRKVADPYLFPDLQHFLPRSRDLLPLHRVARHGGASCEIWQGRTASALSSATRAEARVPL